MSYSGDLFTEADVTVLSPPPFLQENKQFHPSAEKQSDRVGSPSDRQTPAFGFLLLEVIC